MSNIHYFQRYSQKENVVTNNTLLLFSRLYSFSPNRFESFLKEILEDAPIEVGVSFEQQIKNKSSSIPDASFSQKSFNVIIETKLYQNYSAQQLHNHLYAFDSANNNVLLHLSPSLPSSKFISRVKNDVMNFEKTNSKKIKFICTTFAKVISIFDSVITDYDFEMKEIIEDFKEFCDHSELLPKENHLMRALTCGWTLEENFEFNLYYDPISRGYQNHKYLGVYSKKCIQGIGEIENIVSASLENENLNIIDKIEEVTDDQIMRIKGVIKKAKENNNWDISKDHKFFLVKKLFKTNFKKTTLYPLQRSKYFNLLELLGVEKLPKTEDIAELLNTKEW